MTSLAAPATHVLAGDYKEYILGGRDATGMNIESEFVRSRTSQAAGQMCGQMPTNMPTQPGDGGVCTNPNGCPGNGGTPTGPTATHKRSH